MEKEDLIDGLPPSDRTCASRWGEYADDCFTVGYLIDAEFSIPGDAVETRCMESPDILAQWKAGPGFES